MLVREANGPVWHWSVPQGSISARFSWATHSWGNRHCCMLGHPNMQQCLWDVPAVWLAADRLTPASSSPPYHYQPSLSNQHVKHFPLPPKYLTQPCHTLEAYTSDLLSICSPILLLDFVFPHLLLLALPEYRDTDAWSQCPCSELKLCLLLHSCLLPVLMGSHQISLGAGFYYHSM